jgi:Protein of unknown function (DUF2924)
MSSALGEKLAALRALDRTALCRRWAAAFRRKAPKRISRDLLLRALAYHLQEQAEGGLAPRLRSRLAKLAGAYERDPGFTLAPAPSFKPGTRLVREWKGEIHEVEILEEGFAWRGHRYTNLSRIAREITGTRWSGPLFFGLKKRPVERLDHGA